MHSEARSARSKPTGGDWRGVSLSERRMKQANRVRRTKARELPQATTLASIGGETGARPKASTMVAAEDRGRLWGVELDRQTW